MQRHPIAGLASLTLALGLGLSSVPASAQESPTPAAAAAGPAVSRTDAPVRVHLSTFRGKGTARLYIHRTDGSYTFVCASPCTADMAAHSELRVTLNDNEDDPHTFVVPSDLGTEIDIEARPSVGGLVGSIVTMGTGGAVLISGLAFLALSGIQVPNSSSGSSIRDSYKTVGLVFIGLGVATAAAGLVWFLTRSREPKVEGAPHRAPGVYGRHDTVLGDVAVQSPREATALPATSTPFELHFTF